MEPVTLFLGRLLMGLLTFFLINAEHLLFAETFNLGTATIADINTAFDAGILTSERLVELYLRRIEAYDQ